MNHIYIGNRQSYKSTMAIHKFMEDPENSLLITFNSMSAKSMYEIIKSKYEITHENSIKDHVQGLTGNTGRGSRVNCIIFDEFFFFNENNLRSTWENITPLMYDGTEVYIYSSIDTRKEESQELLIEYFRSQGWKVTYLKGGIKEESFEPSCWLFDIPKHKIIKKEIVEHKLHLSNLLKDYYDNNKI